MEKGIVKVGHEEGLEARALAVLVQTAGRFDSSIHLRTGRTEVNAKSIMGVMTLGLVCGDEVEVIAQGADEKEAVKGLCEFLRG